MNRARCPGRLLEGRHGRKPSKARRDRILAGGKQLVGRQMVMKILTLHRILDLNHILVRAAVGWWSKDSHQRDLAVQRACEKGTQHGQDSDVQEGTHGDHQRGIPCVQVYEGEGKEEEKKKKKRRGRREDDDDKASFLAQLELRPANNPFRQ